MPCKGYFITATDTGVGKTVVTACLLRLFQKQGLNVGAMKPIETGVDPECSSSANSDAKFLIETGSLTDILEEVCPEILKPAAAPYQAVKNLQRAVEIPRIISAFHTLAGRHSWMLVEGIGGVLVPLRRDYWVVDLIRDLDLPVIVVTHHRLGTLNHTLLTLEALQNRGVEIRGVVFNRQEPGELSDIEAEQPELLAELGGVRILGECPYIPDLSPRSFTPELLTRLESSLDVERLLE